MDPILLDINKSSLIIDFGQDVEKARASRTFFEFLLNFYYSELQNKFISKNTSEISNLFIDSVKFLKSKKISYRLSDNAKELESNLSQSHSEYEERVNAALLVKKELFKEGIIKEFSRQLKKYQYKGFKHLIAIQNGANFSVPGSGKTTVAYAYFNYLIENNIIDKLLVIGPRSSFVPWEEEYHYCFGRNPKLKRISGNRPFREKIYSSAERYNIFLTTYQTSANDIEDLIALCHRFRFLVILDEAHYIKRFEGGYWSEKILKLAPFAHVRLVLTGTPAPNSYEDLWNQIHFLWPNQKALGSQPEFRRLSKTEVGSGEIKSRLAPFFFRTSKRDLELPIPKYRKVMVDLAPSQKRIYKALAAKFLAELEETPDVITKLREWRKAKIVRLLEASSNPTLLSKYADEFRVPPIDSSNHTLTDLIYQYSQHEIPSKILILLKEIKIIIKNNEKVVVWTNFILNIKMLSKMLRKEKINFARVYGDIPKDFSENEEDNREKEITRFKTDNTVKVLLANPAACSESISLHRVCKTAIYLDRTFNCGQYLQSLDRIHRLGLMPTDKITYVFLISKDTIDEVIHKRLNEKAKAMEKLLSDDLTVGAFDTDVTDVVGNEIEEEQDYREVMQDLVRTYGKL